MQKIIILAFLFLLTCFVIGCSIQDEQGGPLQYGECGDDVCDSGENTPTYPYYCPQDCQAVEDACNKEDNCCENTEDCENIAGTGGCNTREYVSKVMKDCLDKQGPCPSPAQQEENVTCSCENHKCVTYVTIKIDPGDQACQIDDDCVMAMVKCSCDCGVPVNKIHWQKYLDKQEEMCESYQGPMCKMSCNQTLKCIDNTCTIAD